MVAKLKLKGICGAQCGPVRGTFDHFFLKEPYDFRTVPGVFWVKKTIGVVSLSISVQEVGQNECTG